MMLDQLDQPSYNPSMKVVNIYEAKTHLSKLLDDVQRGEEVIIAKAGHPVAHLTAHKPKRNQVKFGLLKGQIKIYADIVGPDQDVIKMFDDSKVMPDESF
jgi:prevent-host-death family protein